MNRRRRVDKMCVPSCVALGNNSHEDVLLGLQALNPIDEIGLAIRDGTHEHSITTPRTATTHQNVAVVRHDTDVPACPLLLALRQVILVPVHVDSRLVELVFL